jgi:hypothetical protein
VEIGKTRNCVKTLRPSGIVFPHNFSFSQFPLVLIFKDYSTLGVHYRDLQARVHEQERRNLILHEAQPSAVLNFEFLVRERVLVNPDNARTKSALNVLIFSLSKP